jgi:hypothetical protein
VAQELTITGPLREAGARGPRVWLARNLFREPIGPRERVAGRIAAHAPRPAESPRRHELRRRVLLALERTVFVSASLLLIAAAAMVHHVYVERGDMPELKSFVRFELPGTGEVYDTHGRVLIQLAREYRRSISYEEVPLVLRQAVLSAEDKNFFSHGGIEYAALPRIALKSVSRTLSVWWRRRDTGFQPLFPQGGSWCAATSCRSGWRGRTATRSTPTASGRACCPGSRACAAPTSCCASSRRSATRCGWKTSSAAASAHASAPSRRSSRATRASSISATAATA